MNNLRNKICCNEDGDLKNKEEYIAVGQPEQPILHIPKKSQQNINQTNLSIENLEDNQLSIQVNNNENQFKQQSQIKNNPNTAQQQYENQNIQNQQYYEMQQQQVNIQSNYEFRQQSRVLFKQKSQITKNEIKSEQQDDQFQHYQKQQQQNTFQQIFQTPIYRSNFDSRISIKEPIYEYQSSTKTISITCIYCKNQIESNFIILECQHTFCESCFEEHLFNQAGSFCISFKCLCNTKINIGKVFTLMPQIEIFRTKLLENQIDKLKLTIPIVKCGNNNCNFFTYNDQQFATQFYCPLCLYNQK